MVGLEMACGLLRPTKGGTQRGWQRGPRKIKTITINN